MAIKSYLVWKKVILTFSEHFECLWKLVFKIQQNIRNK